MAESPRDLGVSDLSKKLGIAGATAFRILHTLRIEGLVNQDSDTKRYRLGADLAALGHAAAERFDLRYEALPTMERLSSESGMSSYLNIAGSSEVVCIEHVASMGNLDLYGRVGRTMPFHACPSGFVLLAFGPPDLFTNVIGSPLRKFGKNSVVDPAAILRLIEGVRQQGYAYGDSDLEDGVTSVSAPIRDHTGKVVAALGLAGFSVMFDGHEQWLVEVLLDAAREISTQCVANKVDAHLMTSTNDLQRALMKKREA
jgi:IclR family transcriptional regulator, KDG regulon repressor